MLQTLQIHIILHDMLIQRWPRSFLVDLTMACDGMVALGETYPHVIGAGKLLVCVPGLRDPKTKPKHVPRVIEPLVLAVKAKPVPKLIPVPVKLEPCQPLHPPPPPPPRVMPRQAHGSVVKELKKPIAPSVPPPERMLKAARLRVKEEEVKQELTDEDVVAELGQCSQPWSATQALAAPSGKRQPLAVAASAVPVCKAKAGWKALGLGTHVTPETQKLLQYKTFATHYIFMQYQTFVYVLPLYKFT